MSGFAERTQPNSGAGELHDALGPVFLLSQYPPAATRRCGSIAPLADQIPSPEHFFIGAVDNEA